MPPHARLALLQRMGKARNAPLHLRTQHQQAQPRRLTRGPKPLHQEGRPYDVRSIIVHFFNIGASLKRHDPQIRGAHSIRLP